MQKLYKSQERGSTLLPWLSSYHSFSFNHYYDPARMGFGPLRVLNEDHVIPGGGFETHSHQNAQIISLVTYGTMRHRDSNGNEHLLHTGDYQFMNAGSGITHSEDNGSDCEPMGFIQIWIRPRHAGGEPGYQYRRFESNSALQLVASGSPREHAFLLDQNIHIWQLRLPAGTALQQPLPVNRLRRIQLIEGALTADQQQLAPGDGFIPEPLTYTDYRAQQDSLALVFDIAKDSYQGADHETH